MTIHAAKGLEFPIVVIPGFEAGTIPRPLEDERASDREKHFDEQRRITFVAMTRAMRRLFVVCRKGKESPFLEDFDLEQWTIQ
jgi:DNA helicase-2/ATP-dependent DNA helicase PcrA